MTRRFLALALAVGLADLSLALPARAASKIAIAAVGDPAPGDGVFAGPSFVGEPSAAGNGWVAVRTLVVGDATPEVIVATNFATGERTTVARVGQDVSDQIGRIKQFLGRPTINSRGDVAFAAVITPPEDAETDPLDPVPAGIFLWSGGELSVVAAPGLDTGFGILDLTTVINVLTTESGIDVAERTPALNDNGDVAFVAATLDGAVEGGAIFLRRAGEALAPVLKLGDAYEGGRFEILGPPALNNSRTLAFRGLVDGNPPLDGVFSMSGGAPTLLVRDGDVPPTLTPASVEIELFEFGDVVALNDAGDVLCTGGPIFDDSDSALGNFEGSPGVLLIRSGAGPVLVGFPGQRVEAFGERDAVVFDVTLPPDQGSRTAPPVFGPDRTVVTFARLNAGSSQGLLRINPDTGTARTLVRLGGGQSDATPLGGTYLSASSGPALDAAGNLTFSALLEGSLTSQALIWLPASGSPEAGQGIPIGDAVPRRDGFVGGPSFFPPQLNDAGDVVFKSYVTRGPALGLFRWRAGVMEALVRVGDAAPVEGGPRFINLTGDPSLASSGDVAFVGVVEGLGNGVFVSGGGGIRKVAVRFDDIVPEDPDRPGAYIRTISGSPSLDDSGAVVFRGVVQYESRFGLLFPDERERCVFLADATGVRVIVAEGDDSGVGATFSTFSDPTMRGRSVLFRARTFGGLSGLFLYDPAGVRPVALDGEVAPAGEVLGKGFLDEVGDVFFKTRFDVVGGSSAILRATPRGLDTVMESGQSGPEGGIIRSLGRVSVSGNGRVATRVGFEPFSGGVPGLYLFRDGQLVSYLRNGEGGPARIGGRITAMNQTVAVNAADRVAFLGSIGGGEARSAIMLAAPASLRVQRLAFRRGPGVLSSPGSSKPRDRVRFSALIDPGVLPEVAAIAGADDPKWVRRKLITVAVADQRGRLWSGTLASTETELNGRALTKKDGAQSQIAGLRVRFTRRGQLRIAVRSRPFDLTVAAQGLREFDDAGAVVLEPPFSVRIDVGEDGASSVVPCTPKPRRFRCRS